MCVSRAVESDAAGVFSFAALWRAYEVCRRRKRHTRNAQRFEIQALDRLIEIRDALMSGTWRPSRTLCFVTVRPKLREIHAADFGDRVVHHLLVPRLEALFEPIFIHDSYSNRPGKGTHAAADRLQQFLRQVSRNGSRPAWFLQLDIRNFFHTIHRPTLYRLVLRRLTKAVRSGRIPAEDARALVWLVRRILEPDPAANVRYRGDPRLHQQVPPHKRLANAPPGCGIPIGNLTSQFFANVYLNELDQFIKHQLKVRGYVRYVDDFVLVHEDPEQLLIWRAAIMDFLAARLRLTLKAVAEPRPARNGVDFLGYIVHVHHRLVRRRVIGNLHERLNGLLGEIPPHPPHSKLPPLKKGSWGGFRTGDGAKIPPHPPLLKNSPLCKRGAGGDFDHSPVLVRLPRRQREQLRSVLASYLGHFSHADAHRLTQSLWCRYPWLALIAKPYFPPLVNSRRKDSRLPPLKKGGRGEFRSHPVSIRLIPLWQPLSVSSLVSQWRFFHRQGPGIVLMRVGRQVEAYGEDALLLRRLFGLRLDERRRPGLGPCIALPPRAVPKFLARLVKTGVGYRYVVEEGYLKGGLKRRVLAAVYAPLLQKISINQSEEEKTK